MIKKTYMPDVGHDGSPVCTMKCPFYRDQCEDAKTGDLCPFGMQDILREFSATRLWLDSMGFSFDSGTGNATYRRVGKARSDTNRWRER
jgi:hypothetical protein